MELLPELTGLQLHCGVITGTLLHLLLPRVAAQVVPQLIQEVRGEEGGEGDVLMLSLHGVARWLP